MSRAAFDFHLDVVTAAVAFAALAAVVAFYLLRQRDRRTLVRRLLHNARTFADVGMYDQARQAFAEAEAEADRLLLHLPPADRLLLAAGPLSLLPPLISASVSAQRRGEGPRSVR